MKCIVACSKESFSIVDVDELTWFNLCLYCLCALICAKFLSTICYAYINWNAYTCILILSYSMHPNGCVAWILWLYFYNFVIRIIVYDYSSYDTMWTNSLMNIIYWSHLMFQEIDWYILRAYDQINSFLKRFFSLRLLVYYVWQ